MKLSVMINNCYYTWICRENTVCYSILSQWWTRRIIQTWAITSFWWCVKNWNMQLYDTCAVLYCTIIYVVSLPSCFVCMVMQDWFDKSRSVVIALQVWYLSLIMTTGLDIAHGRAHCYGTWPSATAHWARAQKQLQSGLTHKC